MDEQTSTEKSDQKTVIKQQQYEGVTEDNTFIEFRGTALVRTPLGYKPLTSKTFASLFYKRYPFATKTQISEVEHLVMHSSPDHSHLDYLIAFPNSKVWDTRKVEWLSSPPAAEPVLRSPVSTDPSSRPKALKYMLELADGDELLAWDMLQALAPIFLDRKPAGVIWFIGGGANGKSALINAIYKIIGDHLCSLTVAAIEDGRDVPRLNGVIGNICRESSEKRVEDSERYKAIGTHEPFSVHRFHSQEMVDIQTNFHTIFNANNIPIFADKTEGARRRTLIVPFPAKFKDDPNFEDKTFTPEFLGGLLTLVLEAAQIIKKNNYKYKFSDATVGAKEDYDSEVNSAEAFLEHLRDNKVKAFTNYHSLKMNYENWCGDNGYVPLGINNLKRTMVSMAKATKTSYRDGEGVTRRHFFIDESDPAQPLTEVNGMQVGLGLRVEKDKEVEKPVQAMLGKDW